MCVNSLYASIVAWPDSSQKSRYGVQVNRSVREESVKRFEQS